MKLSGLLLAALFVTAGQEARAQSASYNPLFLGEFGVTRIYAGAELALSLADSGWKAVRSETELTLSNSDHGKTYSARSVKFAEKVVLSRKTNDAIETYTLYGSRPFDRQRLIFKVERSIEYPKSYARPLAADLVKGLNSKWGRTSLTKEPPPPRAGETSVYTWYYGADGRKLDRNQNCEPVVANAQTITRYRLEDIPAVESAEQGVCNAFVSARVTIDDKLFVEKVDFVAYSNYTLYKALTTDKAWLEARLEEILNENATQRRRVLGIPQL